MPWMVLLAWLLLSSVTAAQGFEEIDGHGDDVVETISLSPGLLLLAAAHHGDSNFALLLYDVQGDRRGLLVNTIGSYVGMRAAPVPDAGPYTIQVTADGPWRIRYYQPSEVSGEAPPVEHTATGDLVLGPIQLSPGLLRARFTHAGDSNFAVVLYHADGRRIGLLVNEIGAYSGTGAQQIREAGPYYLDIVASGEWSASIP